MGQLAFLDKLIELVTEYPWKSGSAIFLVALAGYAFKLVTG